MITVGQILREQRQKKGILLKDVESNIRVRQKFLHSIEENDWSIFSSKIYIVGIIRSYSQFLGLDPKRTLAFFRRDYEKKDVVRFKQKVKKDYLTPETKRYATVVIFAVCIIFAGYFAYQLKLYLTPPQVKIITPQKQTFINEDKIQIKGKTDPDATVTIYNERIFLDKDGYFIYDFPLHNGKNIFLVNVVGANGKKVTVTKTFTKE